MPYTNSGQAGTSGVGHLTALASEAWGFLNHSTDLWLSIVTCTGACRPPT